MAEPRGTVVGKLIYLITGDESALKTDLDKARKNIKAFGGEMDRLGSRLTTTLTLPIAAAGIAALKFATELETSQETTAAFKKTLDDLKVASASMVESFLPAIRGLLDWVSRTAKAVAGWDETTKRIVVTMAAAIAVIGPLMKAIGTLTMLISANPYVAFAAVLGTIVVAVTAWVAATNQAKRASSDLAAQLKTTTMLVDDQAIALASERKEAALLRAQVLEPELALRKEQLAGVRSLLAAERERSGVVRNLDTATGQSASTQRKLTLEEAKLTNTVLGLSTELETQTTIYTESHRLIMDAIKRREELAKTITDVSTPAIVAETEAIYDEAAAIAADGAQWDAFTQLIISRLRDAADAEREAEQEAEKLRQKYEQVAAQVYGTLAPAFRAMGQAIADSSEGWEVFKEAAKDAIASVLEAYARQWAVLAAASLVPGPTFNPAAALGLGLQSAAALVAAGFVRALASGGDFVTNGPQLIAVGDNPGGRERVTVTPESSPNIGGGDGLPLHVTINLDGRPIADFVTRASRRRSLLIDAGSVVG